MSARPTSEDPPIEATADHEQITPPPEPQGFTSPDSIAECRELLFSLLHVEIDAVTAKAIMEAIELLARRIAVDMLQSQEFKSAAGEIASNMDGQSVPILLECDELQTRVAAIFNGMFNYAFGRRSIPLLESDRFKAKVMDIAWPKIDADADTTTAGEWVRTVEAIFKTTMQEHLLETDEFEQKIRAIVDERMTSNLKGTIRLRGKTQPDAERHPDAQIVAPPITDTACDHQWEDTPTEDAGVRKYCVRCGTFRPIRPTDVKEEIVEIDEEGNVKAVESTVHTKPIEPFPDPTPDPANISELDDEDTDP